MSRYIEADKVLMALRLDHKDVIYIDKNDTAKRIEKIPNIDIVRCKECKWHGAKMIPKSVRCIAWHKADDFCSYGERKEKEITTDCSWR